MTEIDERIKTGMTRIERQGARTEEGTILIVVETETMTQTASGKERIEGGTRTTSQGIDGIVNMSLTMRGRDGGTGRGRMAIVIVIVIGRVGRVVLHGREVRVEAPIAQDR